jgi:3-methyladenine DNA glycosylase AlkD
VPTPTLPAARALADELQQRLAVVADRTKSEPMRAYMKNDFVFLGVPAPIRRTALRTVLREHDLSKRTPVPADWLTELALTLAKGPSREAQYLAGDVLDVFGRSTVPAMLETIVAPVFDTNDPTLGGWWDLVDHYVGCLLAPLGARFDLSPTLRRWLRGSGKPIDQRPPGPFPPELSKVRIAILSQLGLHESTDEARLFEFCAHRAADREFFVAKAIGWALRDYSYTAPEAVAKFVDDHPELTNLAKREALKAIVRRSR